MPYNFISMFSSKKDGKTQTCNDILKPGTLLKLFDENGNLQFNEYFWKI